MEAAARSVNTATGKDEFEMAYAALDGFAKQNAKGDADAAVFEETGVVPHGDSVNEDKWLPEVRTLRLEQQILNLKLQLLEQRVKRDMSGEFEDVYNHHWDGPYSPGASRSRRENLSLADILPPSPPSPPSKAGAYDYTGKKDPVRTTKTAEQADNLVSSSVADDGHDEEFHRASPGHVANEEIEDVQEHEHETSRSAEEQASNTQPHTPVNEKHTAKFEASIEQKVVFEPDTDVSVTKKKRARNFYGSGDDEGLEISEERAIGEADDVEIDSEPVVITADANILPNGTKESQTAASMKEGKNHLSPETDLNLPELYDPPKVPPQDVS